MIVKDCFHTELVQIHPDATLLEAAERMLASNTETLLVMEGNRLLGVIGLRDLFTAPVPAYYGNTMLHHENEAKLLRIWKTTPVRNLMNERVLAVNEGVTLLRALQLMINTGKHPLPVLRDGKVIGTISRMDIVRALVAHQESSI
jgi:CBS domain-containing protein